MFDATITLGNIFTILTAVIGFVYVIGRSEERLKDIGRRIKEIEINQKQITEILVDLAKSKIELQLISKRIDDLQQYGSHRLAEIVATAMQRNPGS